MSNAVYSSQSEFAAFVGIDWADRKHVWAVQGLTRSSSNKAS